MEQQHNYFGEEVQETGVSLELSKLLTFDKADIFEVVSGVIERVNDGWVDPLDALIYAKKGELLFKEVISGIKAKVEIPTEKGYTKYNAQLTEKMTGVKYDYSACGDTEWNELQSQIEALTEKRKERETFLKSIKKETTIVNDDTGEVETLQPAVKSGSLSISLTLK